MTKSFSIIAIFTLMLGFASTSNAADHLDAPAVMDDGRLDINDLYIFQSFEDSDNSVMIMTVNPVAGVFSPTSFNPAGFYRFEIDNTGDAVADVVYETRFGAVLKGGLQRFTLRRNGRVIARGATGQDTMIRAAGGGQVRCDLFEDPFFFDLNGFNDGFNFTGEDFFAGLNVSAIVVEVPSSQLNGADSNISVTARTRNKKGTFDRMGRPAINTVLIPSELKDAFNNNEPSDDPAAFGAIVKATIESLNGGDSATAEALAAVLLPDVLTFDTSSSAGFLNGRQLADDVIDAELSLLTNGALTTDMVDQNDVPFLNVFPYLQAPN